MSIGSSEVHDKDGSRVEAVFIIDVSPTSTLSLKNDEIGSSCVSLDSCSSQVESKDFNSTNSLFGLEKRRSNFSETEAGNKFNVHVPERWPKMAFQMAIPLFLAGLGMTGAGLLLDEVMTWDVFLAISDLLVLVTPLLGLKGDLEMTLASRLSTHANLGRMNTRKEIWKICFANMCLDQMQAIICGFLAAVLAISMGMLFAGESFNYENAILLFATSCTTASIVSLVLGSTMCTVIVLARKANCNPDNIATPVAGSLGDVVTLGSLALIASLLFANRGDYPWLPYIFLGLSVTIIPFCAYVAYRNDNTRPILKSGWAPVLISVAISSGGGLVLEQSSGKYASLALYQPLINGIGGNMVCILASRLATHLHRDCVKGTLPGSNSVCISPITAFFGKGEHATAARVLMAMICPLQLAFVAIIYFSASEALFNAKFLLLFEAASFLQLLILLYSARILVNFSWKRGWDPDTSSIPYLTAIGDLVGSTLLLVAFICYTAL